MHSPHPPTPEASGLVAPVRAGPLPGKKPAPRPHTGHGPATLWADRFPLLLLLGAPVAITLWGLHYYLSPLGARVRNPLHPLLRPSGTIGLALGIAAFSLFLFLWLYPLRKKLRWLAWMGPLGTWLRLHSLAGLAIPVLAAAHAGWRFDGLIGLGYFAMLVVALSGIVGRYLYVHIPRSRNGLELGREEIVAERRALLTEIAVATGRDPRRIEQALALDPRPYHGLNPFQTLARMARDDFSRVRVLRTLRAEWGTPAPGTAPVDPGALDRALQLARREIAIGQQVRMLETSRRLFGLWHVAHRPFAITALLAVVIHVIVAFAVGAVRSPGG
jgi:hypothetical protein